MHTKYDNAGLKEIILQSSSYSAVSKYIKKTGISTTDKMDIGEFLELIETAIVLILADIRHYE